jgi:hypothetical protein
MARSSRNDLRCHNSEVFRSLLLFEDIMGRAAAVVSCKINIIVGEVWVPTEVPLLTEGRDLRGETQGVRGLGPRHLALQLRVLMSTREQVTGATELPPRLCPHDVRISHLHVAC